MHTFQADAVIEREAASRNGPSLIDRVDEHVFILCCDVCRRQFTKNPRFATTTRSLHGIA
jgi:hypothetical protein